MNTIDSTAAVRVCDVMKVEGAFAASAENGAMRINWRHGCNDWPADGQLWLVKIDSIDVSTGHLSATALMRED